MNEMRRVDELMTGERLREFSESKTVYTNYLGDDIFEVVYWEGDDGQQDVDSDKILGQLMSRDEAVGYLKSADVLGIKIVSARRSNLQMEDNKPLYEVRWIDLHPDLEVSPEELNTGPDTTENINEVVEQAPGEKQDPETERISKAVERMKWRNRNNFREEDVRDSGDVMFSVDYEPQGLQGNVDPLMSKEFLERYRKPIVLEEPIVLGPNPVITPGAETYDDIMYPDKEDVDKETEESNKNVSHPADYYQYGRILERMDDTHRRKNSDYGDAAYKGYKKYGDYYFLVQLHNKLTRLESLTINNKSQQVKEESIDDTLLDMANYAVMYLESRHRND